MFHSKVNIRYNGNKNNFVDYIFWLCILLFTNPGGIQEAFGLYELIGGINLNDILFVILSFCYFYVSFNNHTYDSLYLKRIKSQLLIFFIYFFIVFGYFTPLMKNPHTNVIFNFIKLRHSLYSIAIFFFVLYFWKRSWRIFIKLYVYSSIIILIIFLQSLTTGIDLLPRVVVSRHFIDIDRNLLITYGLLPLLTPIGAAIIIFRTRTEYHKLFIIGFILMNITWVISLTRRHIVGLVIFFIIGFLIYNYFSKVKIGKGIKSIIKSLIYISILFMIINIIFPKYIIASMKAIESTVHIIRYGEDVNHVIDERMGFGREVIIDEFIKSPLFGTGFDNLWRSEEGEHKGYEASDYPFQAALGMTGIIGCLMFLPVYIIAIKMLMRDLKHLKRNKLNLKSLEVLLFITFIMWLIYNFINYASWFSPVSNSGNHIWYLSFALYCSSREVYYRKFTNRIKSRRI